MNEDKLREIIEASISIIEEVGVHVADFEKAMKRRDFAAARKAFVKVKIKTIRLRLKPSTSHIKRVMLDALRDEMLEIILDHDFRDICHLFIGR